MPHAILERSVRDLSGNSVDDHSKSIARSILPL